MNKNYFKQNRNKNNRYIGAGMAFSAIGTVGTGIGVLFNGLVKSMSLDCFSTFSAKDPEENLIIDMIAQLFELSAKDPEENLIIDMIAQLFELSGKVHKLRKGRGSYKAIFSLKNEKQAKIVENCLVSTLKISRRNISIHCYPYGSSEVELLVSAPTGIRRLFLKIYPFVKDRWVRDRIYWVAYRLKFELEPGKKPWKLF